MAGGIRRSGRSTPVAKKRIRTEQTGAQVLQKLKADLAAATQKGPGRSEWLSHAEAQGLISTAEQTGDNFVIDGLKDILRGALQNAAADGDTLKLGNAALELIAGFIGEPAANFRTAVRTVDKQAEHNLGEGLAKEKAEISTADAAQTKNQLENYRIDGQAGRKVSKKEFSPEFKTAQAVTDSLEEMANQYLADNAPGMKAAADAVGPQVKDMVSSTVAELGKNPEAMKRLTNVLGAVGREGFVDAVKTAAPDIGKAFTQASGLAAVNEPVVSVLVDNLPKLAQKFAPEAAESVAKMCTTAALKLGVKEGAEAVAKTALKEGAEAVAKTALKEGAEAVAKVAVKEGAEAAVKTGAKAAAKTGGKAIPVVGNLLSVGSACLAGVGLVKQLFTSPRDGEQIAKAGLNTLLQSVGVIFPWAGLAGDLVDMGWSAKIAVTGGGQPPAPPPKEVAALAADPARLLAAALEGAGQAGAANTFRSLADVTEKAADAKTLGNSEMMAMSQLAQFSNQELTKAAASEQDGATKDALNTLAHGFGEVFKVAYQHKKLKGEGGMKREEVKSQLLKVVADVAMAAGSLYVGGKGVSNLAAE